MKSSIVFFVSTLFVASSALAQAAESAADHPNDAQIAHIVVTANQVDIEAGKLASASGASPEVKAFGKQMVTDHTGVNTQATALAKKLSLKPEDNATSRSLKQGGDENLQHLKTLKGEAFDKAYIDQEVIYHQQVLATIDEMLLPNAKNAELKALIVKVRPAFEAHLEHAQMIQSKLAS